MKMKHQMKISHSKTYKEYGLDRKTSKPGDLLKAVKEKKAKEIIKAEKKMSTKKLIAHEKKESPKIEKTEKKIDPKGEKREHKKMADYKKSKK